MVIAFPTEEDRGLDSIVYGHFGTAPLFILSDSESKKITVIRNQDLGHAHGQCRPLDAFDGNPVDAIVTGGIGGGALKKLAAAGIKTFRAVEGTVADNLNLIENGRLPELAMNDTCSGHGSHEACIH